MRATSYIAGSLALIALPLIIRGGLFVRPIGASVPVGSGPPATIRYRPIDWDRDVTQYNCAGLVFRNYRNMQLAEVDRAVSHFRRLTRPDEPCLPGQVRLWLWTYKIHLEMGGVAVQPRGALIVDDFHIVGDVVTDSGGAPPCLVFSKNGTSPVEGPADPESFTPSLRQDLGPNLEGHHIFVIREHIQKSWYAAWPWDLEKWGSEEPQE